MVLTDLHLHSSLSFDSNTPREDMLKSAAEAGLRAVCFTEHYDILPENSSLLEQECDLNALSRQHEQDLQTTRDSELSVVMGMELGNPHLGYERAEAALSHPGLDFVIGSVHNVSQKLHSLDLYDIRYRSLELCYQVLDDYFEVLLNIARWDRADVLGHINYPLRYMRDRDGNGVSLDRYEDILREILTVTAQNGKGIEVNTSRGTALEDYRPILCLFREVGGRIVTVGSDAHRTQHVGSGIRNAIAMVRACGFDRIALFRDRNAEFLSLED